MFQDPLTSVMAMLLLCFAGILVMFVFVIRFLSTEAEERKESFRKQRLFLADLERQMLDMKISLTRLLQNKGENGKEQAAEYGDSPFSPLTREDPLLSMLEASARAGSGAQPQTREQAEVRGTTRGREGKASLLSFSPMDFAAAEKAASSPEPGMSGNAPDGLGAFSPTASTSDEEDFFLENETGLPPGEAAGHGPSAKEDALFLEKAGDAESPARAARFQIGNVPPAGQDAARPPLSRRVDSRFDEDAGEETESDGSSFKVYRMGADEDAAGGLSPLRNEPSSADEDAQEQVDKLLRDVGLALSAKDVFPRKESRLSGSSATGDNDAPGDAHNALPRNGKKSIDEDAALLFLKDDDDAGENEPLRSVAAKRTMDRRLPDDDADTSDLGASYRALRSRAEKLFENMSGALFSGHKSSGDFPKHDDEAPGFAARDEDIYWEWVPEGVDGSLDSAVGERAKAGPGLSGTREMAGSDKTPDALSVPGSREEGGSFDREARGNGRSGQDAAGNDNAQEPSIYAEGGKGEEALQAYASRFLSSRDDASFAAGERESGNAKPAGRKKVSGKRG